MPSLPTGTVTFLFTDIAGSPTQARLGARVYAKVLKERLRLLGAAESLHEALSQ